MKLLAGKISTNKRKYLIIILSVILLAAALVTAYIMGGFRFILGDEPLSDKAVSTKKFSDEFIAKFNKLTLPYSLDLVNFKPDANLHNIIQPAEAKIYLNENDTNYRYFAAGRIEFSNRNVGYIILKEPKNGKFEHRYFMRIFDNYFNIRGQMKIAEFSSDNKLEKIDEAIFYKNNFFSIDTKSIEWDSTGTNIKSAKVIYQSKFKVKTDGSIESIPVVN